MLDGRKSSPRGLSRDAKDSKPLGAGSLAGPKNFGLAAGTSESGNHSYLQKREPVSLTFGELIEEDQGLIEVLGRLSNSQEGFRRTGWPSVDELLDEIEKLEAEKEKFESSIRESNSKLEAETRIIADSNDGYFQEITQIMADKGEGQPGDAGGFFEERKIQDLQNDLAETKKGLNSKMLELQNLQQEIRVLSTHLARKRP